MLWQVEQDPYARAVLAKHWPEAKRYNDVKEAGSHNLERVDLICGGFPCQDISVAGKGAGLDGDRSGLWGEFARIAGELRPRYVVVENVPAIRSRGLGRVLGDLAALGYDAVWDCIPAQSVGAPHRRDRLFIVAWAVSDTDSDSIRDGAEWKERGRIDLQGGGLAQPLNDGKDRAVAHTDSERQLQPGQLQGQERGRARNSREDVANTMCVGHGSHGVHFIKPRGARTSGGFANGRPFTEFSNDSRNWWESEPDVGRVAHGVPSRVDRLKCLGNAVVPQCAEVVGRVVAELERGQG